jgi:hypothetical protein
LSKLFNIGAPILKILHSLSNISQRNNKGTGKKGTKSVHLKSGEGLMATDAEGAAAEEAEAAERRTSAVSA